MTQPTVTFRVLSALVVSGLLFPLPAAAYIDPLSGSIILQVVAAGVLSFVFTMKRSVQWLGGRWNALRNVLRRR